MKKRFISALILSLAVLVPGIRTGAGASVVVDRVVAVVNDDIITLSDVQRELKKRNDIKDERLLLEDMIDRKLQMAAAKRNGMDVTDQELSEAVNDIIKRNSMNAKQFEAALAKEGLTLEQYRSELREQMTMSRLFNKYVRTGLTVDEAEVRAYYDNNPKLYALPEEVRTRQLIVPVPDKATDAQIAEARKLAASLLDRARRGEDFIGLIRQNASGAAAVQDGDFGFMPRGQAIPQIEDATKNLKPGEVAGPVRCPDGFHIIRLEDIRTPHLPFEKVKDEIRKTLYDQKMEVAYRTWLQSLRSDSHIENRL